MKIDPHRSVVFIEIETVIAKNDNPGCFYDFRSLTMELSTRGLKNCGEDGSVKPSYIDSSGTAVQGIYQNVTLVAKDKKKLCLSDLIFASISSVCQTMLTDRSESEYEFNIQTELSYDDLSKLSTFATRGEIHGFESQAELVKDEEALKLFRTFGVDLPKIEFSVKELDLSNAIQTHSDLQNKADNLVKQEIFEQGRITVNDSERLQIKTEVSNTVCCCSCHTAAGLQEIDQPAAKILMTKAQALEIILASKTGKTNGVRYLTQEEMALTLMKEIPIFQPENCPISLVEKLKAMINRVKSKAAKLKREYELKRKSKKKLSEVMELWKNEAFIAEDYNGIPELLITSYKGESGHDCFKENVNDFDNVDNAYADFTPSDTKMSISKEEAITIILESYSLGRTRYQCALDLWSKLAVFQPDNCPTHLAEKLQDMLIKVKEKAKRLKKEWDECLQNTNREDVLEAWKTETFITTNFKGISKLLTDSYSGETEMSNLSIADFFVEEGTSNDADCGIVGEKGPIEKKHDLEQGISEALNYKSELSIDEFDLETEGPKSKKVRVSEKFGGEYNSSDRRIASKIARKRKLASKVLRNISNAEDDDPDYEPEPEEPYRDESSVTCKICVKVFSSKYKLEKHKKNCYNSEVSEIKRLQKQPFWFPQEEKYRDLERPYQCKLCVRGFLEKFKFEQHVRRHSTRSEKDLYFCIHCPGYVAFPDHQKMKEHVTATHQDDQIRCPYCDKKYELHKKHYLKGHIENEHIEQNCISCGTTFKNKYVLKEHVKQQGKHHDGKCRICPDFEAKTWDENLAHMNQYHDGNLQYKCGFCQAFFEHEILRRRHIPNCPNKDDEQLQKYREIQEKNSQKVTCEICAKEIHASNIQMHINSMHGDHQIPCTEPGCDFIIRHPSAVKRHMRLVHLNTTCSECGWFGQQRHYRRHVLQKHTAVDKKPFKCTVCPKSFSSTTVLKDHMNVHTGEKPHKCPVCGQGFASNPTMRGHHKAVHLGIKRK